VRSQSEEGQAGDDTAGNPFDDIEEPATFKFGDKVEIKMTAMGTWMRGTVMNPSPLKVKVPNYGIVSPANVRADAAAATTDTGKGSKWYINQPVEFKDDNTAKWEKGYVGQLNPLQCKFDITGQSFEWDEVRPRQTAPSTGLTFNSSLASQAGSQYSAAPAAGGGLFGAAPAAAAGSSGWNAGTSRYSGSGGYSTGGYSTGGYSTGGYSTGGYSSAGYGTGASSYGTTSRYSGGLGSSRYGSSYRYVEPPIEDGPEVKRSEDMTIHSHNALRRQVGGDPYTAATAKTERGCTGLKNPMFWCFFNAAMQCLSHTPALAEKFMELEDIDEKRVPVLASFVKLLQDLWSGDYGSVKASGLFAAVHNQEVDNGFVQYTDTKQQDSLGALERVIDMIMDEMKAGEVPNIFDEVFGHTMRRTKECSNCGHREVTEQRKTQYITHLAVLTPDGSHPKRLEGREESKLVQDALEKDPEAVSLNAMWDYNYTMNPEDYKCDKCEAKETTTLKDCFVEPPKCFMVGIKRFKSDMYGNTTKITDRVIVEKEVDIASYMAPDAPLPEGGTRYEAFAMQRHFGSSLNGGHYTSRIKVHAQTEGEEPFWRDFDDARVSEIAVVRRATDDLHQTENKRWDEADVFASHLIYSVMYVQKPVEEDDDLMERTNSCFFEAKPKPFVWSGGQVIGGSYAKNDGRFKVGQKVLVKDNWEKEFAEGFVTEVAPKLKVKVQKYANAFEWHQVKDPNAPDKPEQAAGATASKVSTLGGGGGSNAGGSARSKWKDGYVWTAVGISRIPDYVKSDPAFLEPSPGQHFTQEEFEMAQQLTPGTMTMYMKAGNIEKGLGDMGDFEMIDTTGDGGNSADTADEFTTMLDYNL